MKTSHALTLTLALASVTSFAQDDPEKVRLRKEIEELKRQQAEMREAFDKRIAELEKRIEAKPKEKAGEPSPVKTEIVNQIRYDFDSGGADSSYVRRVEMRFTGRVNPRVSWAVMIDPAKTLRQDGNGDVDQASRMLQDAYATIQLAAPLSLDMGQKKIPFSLEALQSTSTLDTLERALFLAQGRLGDVRDQGLWLNGRWPELEVTASLLNGAGESQNQKDLNEQKSFGGRVVFKPKSVPGLQVGGAGISGTPPSGLKKERFGLEGQYRDDHWTLRAEAATGLTEGKRATGWYGHVGRRFGSGFEGVLRYDTFDPDRSAPNDDVRDFILGLNYYLQDHAAKLQFNWVARRFGDRTHRSYWQFGLQTRW